MFKNLKKSVPRFVWTQPKGRTRQSKPEEKKPFEWSKVFKYARPVIFILGVGYFVRKSLKESDDNQFNKNIRPANPMKPVGKLIVTRIDDKLTNYDAAFIAATNGSKAALAYKLKAQQLKLLDAEFDALEPEQITQLLVMGKQMRKANKDLSKATLMAKEMIRLQFVTPPPKQTAPAANPDATTPGGTAIPPNLPPGATITVDPVTGQQKIHVPASEQDIAAEQLLMSAFNAKIRNEISLMKNIERVLSANQKTQLMMIRRPSMVIDILSSLLDADALTQFDFVFDKIHHLQILPKTDAPKVYVLEFKGDVMASQVEKLREEITGVLANCNAARGDRVLLNLHSGGGSVTGYGLASSQLNRLKTAGIPLTICVDEVAASGGYMMAAVADRIVASPFAILGSIGVITTVPNFSNRLAREGIEVEDVTAGKFKRTLTPYKKATPEDRAKMKSDIEDIFVLFKDFLKRQRPGLDVEKIATGEVWFGPDALKRGLCDELLTSDDVIMNHRREGAEVYRVELIYQKPVPGVTDQLISAAFGSSSFDIENDRLEGESTLMYYGRKMLAGIVSNYFTSVVQGGAGMLPGGMMSPQQVTESVTTGEVPINQRFMAVDESVVSGRGPRL